MESKTELEIFLEHWFVFDANRGSYMLKGSPRDFKEALSRLVNQCVRSQLVFDFK